MRSGLAIVRQMQKIAARKLQNTQGVLRGTQDKLELIELAFGKAAVLSDFEKWCDENADRDLEYPLTDYSRVVDARLRVKRKSQPESEQPKYRGLAEVEGWLAKYLSDGPKTSNQIRDEANWLGFSMNTLQYVATTTKFKRSKIGGVWVWKQTPEESKSVNSFTIDAESNIVNSVKSAA